MVAMQNTATSEPIKGSERIGLDEKEMAACLGVSVHWLRRDRYSKRVVPFFRLGDRVLYSPERVREALQRLECGGPRK